MFFCYFVIYVEFSRLIFEKRVVTPRSRGEEKYSRATPSTVRTIFSDRKNEWFDPFWPGHPVRAMYPYVNTNYLQ